MKKQCWLCGRWGFSKAGVCNNCGFRPGAWKQGLFVFLCSAVGSMLLVQAYRLYVNS